MALHGLETRLPGFAHDLVDLGTDGSVSVGAMNLQGSNAPMRIRVRRRWLTIRILIISHSLDYQATSSRYVQVATSNAPITGIFKNITQSLRLFTSSGVIRVRVSLHPGYAGCIADMVMQLFR